MRRFAVIFMVVGALGVLWSLSMLPSRRSSMPSPTSEEDEHFKAAVAAAAVLRDSMRNPDSFRLAKAILMKDGAACFEYRAQNGFGGMNVGYAVTSPADQRVFSDEMPGFHPLFDKECSLSGTDRTSEVEYSMEQIAR